MPPARERGERRRPPRRHAVADEDRVRRLGQPVRQLGGGAQHLAEIGRAPLGQAQDALDDVIDVLLLVERLELRDLVVEGQDGVTRAPRGGELRERGGHRRAGLELAPDHRARVVHEDQVVANVRLALEELVVLALEGRRARDVRPDRRVDVELPAVPVGPVRAVQLEAGRPGEARDPWRA